MPGTTNLEQNISEVPYLTIKKICDGLDQKGKWREVIAEVTERKFQFKPHEIEKIATAFQRLPNVNPSPSHDMWHQYGDRGMKVKHMIKYLDKLKLEAELILLKCPEPLRIVEQPPHEELVKERNRLRLSCVAVGFPYPQYTWFAKYKDKQEYEEVDKNQTGILEIKRIRRTHAGDYQCRVHNTLTIKKNKNGEDYESLLLYSNWCTVDVVANNDVVSDDDDEAESTIIATGYLPQEGVVRRPRIIKQPEQGEIYIYNNIDQLFLECLAEGQPPPAYQWMHNDTVLHGQTRPTLLIQKCTMAHRGHYWCCINNGQEVETTKVKVNVLDKQELTRALVIVEHPGHIQVEENSKTTLHCRAKGEGELRYAWYHADNRKGVTEIHSGVNAESLEVRVTPSTEGTYYCEVTLLDRVKREEKAKERSLDATLGILPSRLVQNPRDKVALFIGIEEYRNHRETLKAVPWDMQAVSIKFQKMGYKVITLLDLTLDEMHCAVDLFCDFVDEGVYVLLYVVGHGFHYRGNHYLMPWDTVSGPSPKQCLCLEEIQAKLQTKSPSFLLMIVDMCRTSGDIKLEGPSDVKEYQTKANGNSITIFAASPGEQSYEENQNSNPSDKRGFFCRYFCQVLDDYSENKTVKELFNLLLHKFKNKYLENMGRNHPMHPQMYDNLMAYQIKLVDPINYEDSELDFEKRSKKYNFINSFPSSQPVVFSVTGVEGLILAVSCEALFSNRLCLVIKVNQLGSTKNLDIDVEVPTVLNKTAEKESDSSEFRFQISNLQRLDCDLRPVLIIEYMDVGGKLIKKYIDLIASIKALETLRRPLISRHDIWQKAIAAMDTNNTMLKQATEDEEVHSSLEESKEKA